eukprot:s3213_g4.t1
MAQLCRAAGSGDPCVARSFDGALPARPLPGARAELRRRRLWGGGAGAGLRFDPGNPSTDGLRFGRRTAVYMRRIQWHPLRLPGLQYRKGDSLQVWSDSQGAWMDAVVEEAYLVDTKGRGFTIPAGSLLVRSSIGTSKWVMPDQIGKILRPSEAPSVDSFERGEKIQVWSESRQEWLLGVVQELFLTDTKTEGFDVPAGSLKVLSQTGVKWILPADRQRMVRKVQAPSELDLKAMLKAALLAYLGIWIHLDAFGVPVLVADDDFLRGFGIMTPKRKAARRGARSKAQSKPQRKEADGEATSGAFILKEAQRLRMDPQHVAQAVQLLEEDMAVPFIAKYRKEVTGQMTTEQLAELDRRLRAHRIVEEKRWLLAMEWRQNEALTSELEESLRQCDTLQDLEELHASAQRQLALALSGAQLVQPGTALQGAEATAEFLMSMMEEDEVDPSCNQDDSLRMARRQTAEGDHLDTPRKTLARPRRLDLPATMPLAEKWPQGETVMQGIQ